MKTPAVRGNPVRNRLLGAGRRRWRLAWDAHGTLVAGKAVLDAVRQRFPARLQDVRRDAHGRPRPVIVGGFDQHPHLRPRSLGPVEYAHSIVFFDHTARDAAGGAGRSSASFSHTPSGGSSSATARLAASSEENNRAGRSGTLDLRFGEGGRASGRAPACIRLMRPPRRPPRWSGPSSACP